MPSIIEQKISETERFLARHRRAYLRSVGSEIGLSDLRDLALREAVAMIELAQSLTIPACG
jgi:hypothetical protein